MKRSTVGSCALFFALGFIAEGFCVASAPAGVEALSAKDAVALAEKFVMEQGYEDIQPKAVGARPESDIWFVGFRATVGDQIRGIMISNRGRTLKRVNQSLKLDWLMSQPERTSELSPVEAQKLAGAGKVKGPVNRDGKAKTGVTPAKRQPKK